MRGQYGHWSLSCWSFMCFWQRRILPLIWKTMGLLQSNTTSHDSHAHSNNWGVRLDAWSKCRAQSVPLNAPCREIPPDLQPLTMHFLISDSTLIKSISTDSGFTARSCSSTVACLTPTASCILLMIFLNLSKRFKDRGECPAGDDGFCRMLSRRASLAWKVFAASIVENVRLPLFDMSDDNVCWLDS